MINYCTMDFTNLSKDVECDCGKKHRFSVKCLLKRGAFDSAVEFLTIFAPKLSRIAVICDDERLLSALLPHIKKEFRLTYTDICKVNETAFPEDAKLVLAVGSEKAIEIAKYKAYISDLPVVVCSIPHFTAFSPLSVVTEGGLPYTYKVAEPEGYIFDLDYELSEREKATLFGEVAARLNTSFESYARSIFLGGEYCPYLTNAVADLAAKTVISASEVERNSPALAPMLSEAALKLSLLMRAGGFLRFGEVQCALTYMALGESDFLFGELQLIFSAVLSSLYKSHIIRRKSFTPPPDNNYRLEKISEFFGVKEVRAIRLISPQLSGREAAVMEYKIREYSADLLSKLGTAVNMSSLAFKTFKRLYSDGGYFLSDISSGDVSLSIALAPDLIVGDGMLTCLKRLGELDCYII